MPLARDRYLKVSEGVAPSTSKVTVPPVCEFAQAGKCCVEAHLRSLLNELNTEKELNITWGRLMGAQVNDMPEDVRSAFRYEMQSLSYRAVGGQWKPHTFF